MFALILFVDIPSVSSLKQSDYIRLNFADLATFHCVGLLFYHSNTVLALQEYLKGKQRSHWYGLPSKLLLHFSKQKIIQI